MHVRGPTSSDSAALSFLQSAFPFRFKSTRDKPVLRIHGAIASLGALRVVTRTLDVATELREGRLVISFELLDRLERRFQACGRESRKERFGDSRIDLHTADVEAVLAPAVDDVLAGAVISGRRVPAAVVYGQAPTAVSAYGDALQERGAFSHGTPALVRSRTDVLRQALLVRLESVPIDVSGMMVTNENRPLLAAALFDSLSDSTARHRDSMSAGCGHTRKRRHRTGW